MEKTMNYSQFKLIEANRPLIEKHVRRLANSITSQNLLQYKPIQVNAKMEVIDGQHRLRAAERLGVPIYYEVQKDLVTEDIMTLNIMHSWGIADFLHFHVQQGSEEYIKFNNFLIKNNLTIRIGLNLCIGQNRDNLDDFRKGKFIFNLTEVDVDFHMCKWTIDVVKKENGFSAFTLSAKFWKALITLARHPNFDMKKWESNLVKMANRVSAKVTWNEYLKSFLAIYNWRNQNPIDFETINDRQQDEPQGDLFK